MRLDLSSRIMRTTIDLDPTVLDALKRRQRREGKSLGQLASELLARALADEPAVRQPFRFYSQPMEALIDLEDHDAVERVLTE